MVEKIENEVRFNSMKVADSEEGKNLPDGKKFKPKIWEKKS